MKRSRAGARGSRAGARGTEGRTSRTERRELTSQRGLVCDKYSRDVKIQSFSISLFGKQLFEDQTLELTYGHRYGLVAQNVRTHRARTRD